MLDAPWAMWDDGNPGRPLGEAAAAAAAEGAEAAAAEMANNGDNAEAGGPGISAVFAGVELALLTNSSADLGIAGGAADDDGAVLPLVSLGAQADCTPLTAQAISYADREQYQFYSSARVSLPDGGGGVSEAVVIDRYRPDLADDRCPLFEHAELGGLVALRVEDISEDADGVASVHGCCLYTKSQLPTATAAKLPSFHAGFDALPGGCELIESIDQVEVPLLEVRGFTRVLQTSRAKEIQSAANLPTPAGGVSVGKWLHQEAVFVDERESGPWKLKPATAKQRPGEPEGSTRKQRAARR